MLLSFMVKFVLYWSCEKNQNKQKEAGFGPFCNKGSTIVAYNCMTRIAQKSIAPFLAVLVQSEI